MLWLQPDIHQTIASFFVYSVYSKWTAVNTWPVASRNNFFWGCPLHWGDATEYIQQEINNDNSHKTVKSRLTFTSAFSIMVTVTLMKTALAKNLSHLIIICVELECGTTTPYFCGDARASPGFHYGTPLHMAARLVCALFFYNVRSTYSTGTLHWHTFW